jgi:hypothetical protein
MPPRWMPSGEVAATAGVLDPAVLDPEEAWRRWVPVGGAGDAEQVARRRAVVWSWWCRGCGAGNGLQQEVRGRKSGSRFGGGESERRDRDYARGSATTWGEG